MKTLNIHYSIPDIETSATSITGTEVTMKGRTSVSFILTSIPEDVTKALFLTIDYGDITPIQSITRPTVYDYTENTIFDEILYGQLGGSILTKYTHIYSNTTQYEGISFKASLTLRFSSGKNIEIVQPFCLYTGSFYDDLKSITAINTQIIPVSSNKTFVNLECAQQNTVFPTILDT